ncbi:hypothetical protein EDC05_001198 [Coemansia umbellata]|nr:hypothetical protein EDC05_001198 [Coemansia umbellata]
MSTTRPLTEQELSYHVQLHSTVPRNTNMSTSAAACSGMPEAKLAHVLRYIEDHLNSTQESPPMTEASREFFTGKDARAAVQRTGKQPNTLNMETREEFQQQQHWRKQGKRAALRNGLHSPAKIMQTEQPNKPMNGAATDTAPTSAAFFGAIEVQPARAKDPKKHLGIFNKGKAAASKNTGIAFSETEFLQGTNVCRIQPLDNVSFGDNDTRGECSQKVYKKSKRSSSASTAYNSTTRLLSKDTQMPSCISRWIDIENQPQAIHTSSFNNRPSSKTISADVHVLAPAPCCSRTCCPDMSIVPLIPPQSPLYKSRHSGRKPLAVVSAPTAAAENPGTPGFDHDPSEIILADNGVTDKMACSLQQQELIPGQSDGSLLLASIDEYLNQAFTVDDEGNDVDGNRMPHRPLHSQESVSSSSSNKSYLDISILFDEHENEDTHRLNIRNCSISGLSEFDSNFFASQDISCRRCPGDITISDFGNSRYGPGFWGLDINALTGQGRGSLDSVDTLPEYMPRTELPPSYPACGVMPQISNDISSPRDMPYSSYSRANIHLSRQQIPTVGQYGQLPLCQNNLPNDTYVRSSAGNFNGNGNNRNSINNDNDGGAKASRYINNIQGKIDFKFFPRRLS